MTMWRLQRGHALLWAHCSLDLPIPACVISCPDVTVTAEEAFGKLHQPEPRLPPPKMNAVFQLDRWCSGAPAPRSAIRPSISGSNGAAKAETGGEGKAARGGRVSLESSSARTAVIATAVPHAFPPPFSFAFLARGAFFAPTATVSLFSSFPLPGDSPPPLFEATAPRSGAFFFLFSPAFKIPPPRPRLHALGLWEHRACFRLFLFPLPLPHLTHWT